MPLRIISRDELDRERWENLLENSADARIYGLPKYLDILCGEDWAVVVDSAYNSGATLFPQKKFGIQYLFQPPFCQTSGIYSPEQLSAVDIGRFIQLLKTKFHSFSVCLIQSPADFPPGIEAGLRDNYTLALTETYNDISSRYSSGLKRKLKKGFEGSIAECSEDESALSDFLNLVKQFFPPLNGSLPSSFNIEKYIRATLQSKLARLLIAKSKDGNMVSGLLYLSWKDRLYLVLPVSSDEGRKSNAMHFVIDHLIHTNAESEITIDFEGSSIPGVARFYKSFGTELHRYHHIKKPFISETFEKAARRMVGFFR